jgi:transcriptional regulator with XRE-family HTH domain
MKIYNIVILHFLISMDIKEKIGFRLRELRTDKGLSQEKFSFECGLDRTYIASIEQGKHNVSIVNIEKIAKAFDMSVSAFFNSNLFQTL